ncbi:MAG: chromosome partitioning protein ParB [Deltaproteobacteria bacterium]|nr:MAG: chromosome partitioning protein ParB [Deltaproteobacteria bacterium]
MVKRKVLGKGLDALLKGTGMPEGEVFMCDIDRITPSPLQPRRAVDEKGLEELASSIREKGLLQPLIVRSRGEGYEIVAGERRWRAALRAGLKKVPVIVREVSDREALEIALVENLQRQDLNPLEEAEAYRVLIEDFGYTQEEVAKRVGKDRSSVANALRLLKLPAEVKEALKEGRITAGHARAILSAGPLEDQLELFRRILKGDLSVREAEGIAKRKRGEQEAVDPDLELLLDELREILRAPVRIRGSRGRGRLEIEFHSLEELERIIEIIREGGRK